MIGPGFAAAAFARDAAIIVGVVLALVAFGFVVGIGTFRLCEVLFGSVT